MLCDNSSQQTTWTSVPQTQIGYLPFTTTGTFSYQIPAIIPDVADEVLVYVYIQMGTSTPANEVTHVKIFTEQGENDYAKYIGLRTWSNSAWNTNSDNLWFPMPSNRRVNVYVSNAHGGNISGYLYVIGYR